MLLEKESYVSLEIVPGNIVRSSNMTGPRHSQLASILFLTATSPVQDFDLWLEQLNSFLYTVYHISVLQKPGRSFRQLVISQIVTCHPRI